MTPRKKFALRHLLLSLLVASFIMAVVFFMWYPYPLGKATGVTRIFLMVVGVDIILGPLLTWLVYKEGKKTLIFDLTIIILIQISALCFGIYHIAQGRPTWIVYSVNRFELVRNNEIYTKNIQQAQRQYQQVSWLKPNFVAIEFAKDSKRRSQDMFDEILGGVEISQRPERYVDLLKVKRQIQKRTLDLNLLYQFNDKAIVQKILAKYPQASGFVPLKANAVDMTVLIDKKTGQVVKIVDLRPWK
ncbi:TfpX/TfpZ family type IV pilin accessory protein [Acinetobacter sp. ANC 4805]|uniref:TfpX/TfpZ family type IV pilin accessory protein n=1 Tax=Acinetobacter sp. ANC 4805 TaxID=2923425 RepID=UPI001F4A5254|nr:TfpX/TfpZ family type IV pilin accessory protein [Acinetobacter sp. ANC 4805]MCH7309975.1 type IV pilin accessory protein [Acinetobacter sp. ANC 4805]